MFNLIWCTFYLIPIFFIIFEIYRFLERNANYNICYKARTEMSSVKQLPIKGKHLQNNYKKRISFHVCYYDSITINCPVWFIWTTKILSCNHQMARAPIMKIRNLKIINIETPKNRDCTHTTLLFISFLFEYLVTQRLVWRFMWEKRNVWDFEKFF